MASNDDQAPVINREAELLRFDRRWRSLAALGLCDHFGGLEYHRVRLEWEAEGFPLMLGAFIERRANLGPQGPDGKP